MAYELKSELCDAESLVIKPGSAKTAGAAEIVNGKIYFYLKGSASPYDATEQLLGITRAAVVEVGCDNTLTYANGESVYEHATTPTGEVNKTSSSRRLVGYVRHPEGGTYAVGTTKIQIRYNGNNEV